MPSVFSKLLLGSALVLSAPLLAESGPAAPQTAEERSNASAIAQLPWVSGPAKSAITTRAEIALDPKSLYLDAKSTNKFLEATGNLPEEDSYLVTVKDSNWFAIYSFADMGYVKDDEKIDADSLLKSLKEGQEEGNVERKEQGLQPLTVTGWAVPPHYDAKTHNLEYGVTLASSDGTGVNYHLRMLGRRGVMDATLITSPETLQKDLAEFRAANNGFSYKSDEKYAAYQDGDKVSEYGLAALITGGAAAAALKGGLFKGLLIFLAKFWKLIALGVAAAFAGLMKLFRRKSDSEGS